MYKESLIEISLKELRFPTSKLKGRLEDIVGATLEDIMRTRLQET